MSYRSELSNRRLAIWLRGLLGGKYGGQVVAGFSQHEVWQMRKEVARALQRLSVWHELRFIEENDLNARVRRIAKQCPPDSFGKRWSPSSLAHGKEGLHGREGLHGKGELTEVKRPLYVDETVQFGTGNIPKSISLIRYYLNQIRNTLSER